MGGAEVLLMMIPMLIAGVVPLLVAIWLLWLANRAVRALESIADSLRRNPTPPMPPYSGNDEAGPGR